MALVDDVLRTLEQNGLTLKRKTRTGNDTGFEIRFTTGEIVNVFDTGNISVQGKRPGRVRDFLGLDSSVPAIPAEAAPAKTNRKVFVVYGHDPNSRTQLEAMLRRWELDPLILDQLPSEGQTLIEKLEKYQSDVCFAVILATPDDEANPVGRADEKKLRARQNVVLELGLLLAKLGRARVAILLKNQEQMERPSDIHGLIYLPFADDVAETKVLLAKEMAKQGIAIALSKL